MRDGEDMGFGEKTTNVHRKKTAHTSNAVDGNRCGIYPSIVSPNDKCTCSCWFFFTGVKTYMACLNVVTLYDCVLHMLYK